MPEVHANLDFYMILQYYTDVLTGPCSTLTEVTWGIKTLQRNKHQKQDDVAAICVTRKVQLLGMK